jgi:quercetin dioxygenase-like cupin family protein
MSNSQMPDYCRAPQAEDDKIRVLRVSYGPHEELSIHSHPSGLIVFGTDRHSKHTGPAGDTREMRGKSGKLQWIDATDHHPENLSSQRMEPILIELKR